MTAYEERVRECKKGEVNLRKMMEEDDKEVRDSKAKVEKAKREVEAAQEGHKKKSEELRVCEEELEKVRKQYRELCTSYSFLDELDDIEKMTLGQGQADKNPREADPLNTSSILETSMLNSSLDASQQRIFQTDLLLKSSPL
jgi:chromosome segregation ATPase